VLTRGPVRPEVLEERRRAKGTLATWKCQVCGALLFKVTVHHARVSPRTTVLLIRQALAKHQAEMKGACDGAVGLPFGEGEKV
jgi:hypothetical protein